MTPERWRRLDELFHAAFDHPPAERDSWLRSACGDDEELQSELRRLLSQDEQAERAGFLTPPTSARQPNDQTVIPPTNTWQPRPETNRKPKLAWATPAGDVPGFTPHDAIRAETDPQAAPSQGALSLVRLRLIRLSITFMLISALMIVWKYVVIRDPDPTQSTPYIVLLVVLGALTALFASSRPLSPLTLELLEAAMTVIFAAAFAYAQYQAMLDFSIRGDTGRAQLVMGRRVLITAVLILSYGIYAPASWRRTVLVVGPIALLPFGTLLLLFLRHPGPMQWLERMGVEHGSSPLGLVGFDAMLLLILAGGSAYGAHNLTQLRRQVKEAKQLGQYRLGRRIGAGGMGEVYLAEHRFLKRPCALKLIRPGLELGSGTLQRFEREVQITATLTHPNTVEIFDYGRTEDGTYYYVMEYLSGLSLEELVKRHGPLPPGRVVYLLRQVCLALSEAHAAGLVHRDVKPSNIFAARRGGGDDVAKVLDFGLVRAETASRTPHLSDDGQILGTPLFMSPEQAAGSPDLDRRSDIYSLGAVAYYLLTGRPPFDKAATLEVLIALTRDAAAPPSQLRAGIPGDLEQVVLRCLAKSPDDRFPNALSLELALSRCECVGDWGPTQAADWWRENEPDLESSATPGAAQHASEPPLALVP